MKSHKVPGLSELVAEMIQRTVDIVVVVIVLSCYLHDYVQWLTLEIELDSNELLSLADWCK